MQKLNNFPTPLLIPTFTLSTSLLIIFTLNPFMDMWNTLTISQGKFCDIDTSIDTENYPRMIQVLIPVENWFIFVIDEWLDTAGGKAKYVAPFLDLLFF